MNDAESETTGSDDGFQGVELEVADLTSGTYLTAKTNVHIIVKVTYTPWSNAMNTRNISLSSTDRCYLLVSHCLRNWSNL